MSEGPGEFQWPYDRVPGGPTPPPELSREEGHSELWGYAILSLLSGLIISVSGIAVWLYVH
jgi:hypothetical protein